MLLDRGQAEEALPHCQEAVRLQPDMAALHHNLGNALRALERYVDARAAYLEALRLDPDLAPAHAHLGLTGPRGPGQRGAALAEAGRRAGPGQRHLPGDPGRGLHGDGGAGRGHRALRAGAGPRPRSRGPSVHLSLGWASRRRAGWPRRASITRRRCEMQPDSAAAHLNLGGLDEELGEMDEAEAAFRTALRLQPQFPVPHARLATLLRGKLPDADLAALESGWPTPTWPRARARLLFGLAHVLDARGDYARAAACLREANAISLELAKGNRDYVPAEHEQFVDGLIRAFDAEFFARNAGGRPRHAPAGLRLRPAALGHHADRAGARQPLADPRRRRAAAGPADLRGHPRHAGRPRPADRGRPAPSTARRSAAWPSSTSSGSRASPATAPTASSTRCPTTTCTSGCCRVVFPRAAFIHCRRDLRDIAVSCWMTDFRSIRWANDPEHIASRFQQYRRLMDHWESVLPVPIHDVDYEETVERPGVGRAPAGRRLRPGLGPGLPGIPPHERPVRTASVTQVRQPVYKRSVARWKNYESDLGDLFALLPVREGHRPGSD